MEGEREELKNVDPVLYWKMRSKKALESQGVVVPPPRPRHNRILYWPDPDKLPPGVVHVRHRHESVGLDLICRTCERDIPKSKTLYILCHFYSPDGPTGSPLTRCYMNCPYCRYGWVLGRFIGDADNFHVVAGATKDFPAGDSNIGPNLDPNLRNEAYPDGVLDSPNDFQPGSSKTNFEVIAIEDSV